MLSTEAITRFKIPCDTTPYMVCYTHTTPYMVCYTHTTPYMVCYTHHIWYVKHAALLSANTNLLFVAVAEQSAGSVEVH